MLERRSSARYVSGERLAARRRTRRRRVLIAFFILFLLLLTAAIYGLRQSAVRISRVDVFGPPSLGSSGGASADASLADYARSAMQGTYFGLIPRDSIFFFPESGIRAVILAAHSDIAAISISRSGFTGISVTMNDRAPIARWCGLSPSGPDVDEYCYAFDANGFIYAAAAATTTTINLFRLYASLEGGTAEPLRATIAHAEKLPAAFDFARQLGTFGSPVSRIVIRGDEVDDYLENSTPDTTSDVVSGTRITYVLGDEQNAFTALVSARDTFNLANGSIEYVDLRFNGKVYIKRR